VQDSPTVDDTGEFTVITQNAGAELGGGASTQVLLVTPRGGQDFHGALFEYNRNSAFSANTFGNNAVGISKPFLNRNQFGGKISGPVPIPGFGEGLPVFYKGKGFFFAQYERYELRQTSPATRTILLSQARNGNFTYVDNSGATRTVNVLTGAGFDLSNSINRDIFNYAGGILTVDPTIQARFLGASPPSGNGNVVIPNLTQNFTFNQNSNEKRNGLTGRFDIDINDRNSLYVVYKFNDNLADRPDADEGGFGRVPFAAQGGPTKLFILNYRTIFGSNFVNEARGAYSPSRPFFKQSPTFPSNFVIGGLPFDLSSPEPSFQSQGRSTKQYTFQDNASYSVGKQSIRFGIDFNAQRIQATSNFNQTPIFSISDSGNPATPGLFPTLFPGGISDDAFANADALRYLLGGIVGGGNVAANFVNPEIGPKIGNPLIQRLNYDTTGLYVSDQWRVSPKLTLNFGLRYDYFGPLTNPDQAYLEPDLKGATSFNDIRSALLNPNGQYVLVGSNAGVPGRFFKGDKNNFGPNISFAYTPGGGFLKHLFGKENQTVIRGGFRIGYINDEYVRSADNAGGANAGLNQTIAAQQNGSASLNARFNNLPGFTLPPFSRPPISFAEVNANDPIFFNPVFAIDPKIQAQRNMEYNFGIQREIGFDTAIEVRYVGGRSDSLVRAFDFNQVIIRENGLLADFQNARFNLLNFNSANCRTAGCLPVGAFFNRLGPGDNPAFFGSGFPESFLRSGNVGDYASILVFNGSFFPNAQSLILRNPNAGVVDFLTNSGRYRYNALQAEIRRRFTDGLTFQANYTFQKILGDVQGDQQTRFDPFLDINNKSLEYARADYDRTHTVNINTLYELPFGKGKRFLSRGGLSNAVFGGFQLTSIVNISSGVPFSIKDVNGTVNRNGRSGRQTATANLTTGQIKDLTGIYKVEGKIYFINPALIGTNGSATGGNNLSVPVSGFLNQAFFRNQPGQTGNLPRNFLNGPWYYNWDASLIKNIAFNERLRLQLRVEAFNVLNNTNFLIPENSNSFNIGSTTFGQIGSDSTYSPRIVQFAARFEF